VKKLLLIFMLLPFSLRAEVIETMVQPYTPIDIKTHLKELKEVDSYLGKFKTMQSRFTQYSNSDKLGGISEGMLYIKRPHKSRWEYAVPSPAILFINADELVFYDADVEQVSYDDVPETPLSLLLSDNFSVLSSQIQIVGIENNSTQLILTLADKKHIHEKQQVREFQSLTLFFKKNPLTLARAEATNADNLSTSITFTGIRFDEPLDDALFVFKDNRKKKKR
jgi:outer membrane lipoprotein-sorting protein